MKIAKEMFEQEYIKRSAITEEFYAIHFVTLECGCEEEGCRGWACVSNNERSIKTHKQLYGV